MTAHLSADERTVAQTGTSPLCGLNGKHTRTALNLERGNICETRSRISKFVLCLTLAARRQTCCLSVYYVVQRSEFYCAASSVSGHLLVKAVSDLCVRTSFGRGSALATVTEITNCTAVD